MWELQKDGLYADFFVSALCSFSKVPSRQPYQQSFHFYQWSLSDFPSGLYQNLDYLFATKYYFTLVAYKERKEKKKKDVDRSEGISNLVMFSKL